MLRVLMVAEARLYCDGLASVLGAEVGIEVVGKMRRWQDAVKVVAELRPDIVLVDLPFQENRAAVRQLTVARTPPVRVVISWAETGIAGFVTRDDSLANLVSVVRSVARDEMPCSPRVAATLLRRVGALATTRPEPEGRLTARELEIVTLIERGLSNREIGRDLCIQVATVKNHVHNILEKLHVSRRADAVALVRGRASQRELQPRRQEPARSGR
jgi:two-component system, NarL family, nitrate/nitrite response regulator NarL